MPPLMGRTLTRTRPNNTVHDATRCVVPSRSSAQPRRTAARCVPPPRRRLLHGRFVPTAQPRA